MAIEWYLMNTNHDTVSGLESESFNNYAKDAFEEATKSSLGIDVEICNFDLSKRIKVRVIVQGNVKDTKLKSMQRMMLAPIGTCEAGQYVFYKNRYWLIVGLVDDNGMYEKAILIICNYLLTWENEAGNIIQRWVNASSASQYNNGETSNQFYFVRSDQLMILTPNDEECLLIKHRKRFIIDKRCKIYEKKMLESGNINESWPLITYEMTRMDNVLFDYQDSGHSEFMAYQDEQHENDGYYFVNGKGYWLCDVPTANDEEKSLSCEINCEEPVIYNGLEHSLFYSTFYDSDGNTIQVQPTWEINCDFKEELNIEYFDNVISISVDNDCLVNKSFELSLCASDYKKVTITVMIKAFI